jgi:tRNA (pseudouridine54-N1)-methyltransferase
MSIMKSHSMRHDTIFHAVLNGAPRPPLVLSINGGELHDVRVDEETWTDVLRNVLDNKGHPGISLEKGNLKTLLSGKKEIYVLEEDGEDIRNVSFGENPVFIIGDHVGLPRKEENEILKVGKKISLGKTLYLAASCVDIINYELDRRA